MLWYMDVPVVGEEVAADVPDGGEPAAAPPTHAASEFPERCGVGSPAQSQGLGAEPEDGGADPLADEPAPAQHEHLAAAAPHTTTAA